MWLLVWPFCILPSCTGSTEWILSFLHESMNAVPAVMRVVQAIDPISHAPIAQDVVESFIILLDQLGDDLVFFFPLLGHLASAIDNRMLS